ncbi:MAG: RNA polymerase factor sigma-54, partial [Clostridia bacterium]|nr:RNA polymerase factor sigma-54 [Clostridia bacterium]
QLQVARVSPRQRSIGEFLIGNIDDRGYLRIGIEEAARYLKVGPEEVRQALRLVQSFDPPGVGARDLTECLLLQLQQLDARNCLAEKVVRYYLADVAAGRLGRIARNLGVGIQEVQRLVDLIRSLDPKPGRRFGSPADVRYVQPDVIVEKVGDEYVVMVNDGLAPRLGISPLYSSLLRNGELCDPETRRFIEGKLNAATWLIRSIEQRRLTLYRVASCIVDFQREFLDKGIKYLKPLNLRRVAESLGIHESTVSRATANKYLQTPQGLFEFRFFFANNVSSNQQQEAAAQTVKKLLQ